jgi:hypothetical protein
MEASMSRAHLVALAAIVTGGAALGACNSLTGSNGLVLGGAPGATSGGDQSGATTGGSGSGSTTGGSGTGSTTGGSGTGSGSSGAGADTSDAVGVDIASIAVYQGVKRPLETGGAVASSTIPVVAGRDALLRVFVSTASGYDGAPVTAELTLGNAAPLTTSMTISGASTDASMESTFDFDVPGSSMTVGMQYRVDLVQPGTGGSNAGAHYPAAAGTLDSIPVASAGSTMKIVIVPIEYGADGSNRLPDTSSGAQTLYQNQFLAMYPVPTVEITVHAPFPWTEAVTADGSGWSDLLNGLQSLRASDNPASDIYYFGSFDPADSLDDYCGSGCVAGLGMIAGPTDAFAQECIGLGFPEVTDVTAAHEIGHNHGRYHAPCGGATNVDPNWPYATATINDWGYDERASGDSALLSPATYTDVMGYCTPVWVSDYTFTALFDRIQTVNNASIIYPAADLDQTYERVQIDSSGNAKWLTPLTLHDPPTAEIKSVVVETPSGSEMLTGHFTAYDHLDGGVLLWRQTALRPLGFTVEMAGRTFHIRH